MVVTPRANMDKPIFAVEITHSGKLEDLQKFLNALAKSVDEQSAITAEITNDVLQINITANDIKTIRSLGDGVMVAMAEIEDAQ